MPDKPATITHEGIIQGRDELLEAAKNELNGDESLEQVPLIGYAYGMFKITFFSPISIYFFLSLDFGSISYHTALRRGLLEFGQLDSRAKG